MTLERELSCEIAHRVDSFFVQSGNNTEFREVIQRAGSVIDADPNRFMRYCKQYDQHGFISDICSALSGSKYRFPAEHPAERWRKPGAREKEIFANLFSLECFGSEEHLEFIRNNFPDLFAAYRNIGYKVI